MKKGGALLTTIEDSSWTHRLTVIFFFWIERQSVTPLRTPYNKLVGRYVNPKTGIPAAQRSVATMSEKSQVSFC